MTIYKGSYAVIRTRYIGPGNRVGARIVAKCQAGQISIPYPHEAKHEDAHILAVRALIRKLNLDWGPEFAIGTLDPGYIFTPLGDFNKVTIEVTK